jgi:basic membrane protein A
MKKIFVVIVPLLVVSAMLLAACAPAAAPAAPVEPQVIEKTVVVEKVVEKVVEVEKAAPVDDMVKAKEFLAGKKMCAVLPGPVNDAAWNTLAYMAMINMRDNFGMQIQYRERTKPEEAAAILREFADSGCNLIQAHGSEYTDQVNTVAKEYPDVQFMQLSRCTGIEPNVAGACYSSGEGGYFMGRMAAQITKTGKVAFIVGTKYPNMDYNPTMAQQAVKDLKDAGKITKDVIVEEKEVGSWDDPAKAKEVAKALIEQGFDVLIMIADSGDAGIIEAVKEERKAGKDVLAISWVKDRNNQGPDFIIGGWTENADQQIQYVAIQYALNGKPVGKGYPLGVKDGVNYVNPTYGLVSPEIDKDLNDMFQAYKKDPKSVPNLIRRDDL